MEHTTELKAQYVWESFESLLTANQRALLDLFKNNGVLEHHTEGNRIYFNNQTNPGFFWLLKGVIKCEGQPEKLRISGDFIGLREMLEGTIFQSNFDFTATENLLLFVPKEQFLRAQQEAPGLVLPLIKRIHAEVTHLESRMVHLSQRKIEQRILAALELLQKRFGADADFWVPMRISTEDLAGMIGSSKQTVTKKIKQLCDEGILELEGQKFRISQSAVAS
jgi:CRP-like cAMP-binding protein